VAEDDFGDLIYVSRLKVERLHATLRSSPLKRVSSLDLKVMGTGVAAGFADIPDDLIAKLRTVRDGHLRPLSSQALQRAEPATGPMVCRLDQGHGIWLGRWDWQPQEGDVAFFTGRDKECSSQVLLAGSVQHMLDRVIHDKGARTGSTSEALRESMARVLAVEEQGRDPGAVAPRRWDGSNDLEAVARSSTDCIYGFLSDIAARTPLTFLARAIDVFEPAEGRYPDRLVTGTPLYVGIWQWEEEAVPLEVESARPQRSIRSSVR
jgi:hypothetical protein